MKFRNAFKVKVKNFPLRKKTFLLFLFPLSVLFVIFSAAMLQNGTFFNSHASSQCNRKFIAGTAVVDKSKGGCVMTSSVQNICKKFFAQNVDIKHIPSSIDPKLKKQCDEFNKNPSTSITPTPIPPLELNNEILVKFNDSSIVQDISKTDKRSLSNKSVLIGNLINKYSVTSIKSYGNDSILSKYVKINVQPKNSEAIIKDLKLNSNVISASKLHLYQSTYTPNDSLFPQEYSHTQTHATSGWDINKGSKNIKIAIVDSGIDYNHPDLKPNLVADCSNNGCPTGAGYNFVNTNTDDLIKAGFQLDPNENYSNPNNDPMDVYGHGTHVAGIASAKGDNNLGIAGSCYNCNILPIKAGFSIQYQYSSFAFFEEDNLAEAIKYASDNNANVLNLSIGSEYDSPIIHDVINYVSSKGMVIVASAGNSNSDKPSYPASYPGVISVAAMDQNNKRAFYSNYGPRVDIAAPGDYILSTIPKTKSVLNDTSGYTHLSGTSMSAPYISGVAALALSNDNSLTPSEVKTILKQSFNNTQTTDLYIGTGNIDIQKTLHASKHYDAIASISSPMNFETINHDFIIQGEVSGSDVIRYNFTYGEGIYPTSFHNLDNDYYLHPTNGISRTIDSSIFKDGYNNIVLNLYGRNFEVIRQVSTVIYVQNAKISSPQNKDVIRLGDVLQIKGYVNLNATYSVKYSKGQTPTNFISDGITTGVMGDVIASFDTSKLVERDFYTIKLDMQKGANTFTSSVLVYIDPTFKSGWPLKLDPVKYTTFNHNIGIRTSGDLIMSSADLLNDGKKEIITYERTSGLGQIVTYTNDGKILWKQDIPNSNEDDKSYLVTVSPPVVTNLKIDDGNDILVLLIDSSIYKKSTLYSYSRTGSLLWSTPLDSPMIEGYITVGDLNNTGTPQIIVVGKNSPQPIYILDNFGNILKKVQVPSGASCSNTNYNAPVLAKLEGNNNLDIVISGISLDACSFDPAFANKGFVTAYKSDGTLVPGWPIITDGYNTASPAVSNLEGDINDYIVVGLNKYTSGTISTSKIGVYDRFGKSYSKFNSPSFTSKSLLSPVISMLNGKPFIAINAVQSTLGAINHSAYLYVYDMYGNPLPSWPKTLGSSSSQYSMISLTPIISNIGSVPSIMEEVTTDDVFKNGLYIFDLSANTLLNSPYYIPGSFNSSPVVDSISNSGNLTIINTSSNTTQYPSDFGNSYIHIRDFNVQSDGNRYWNKYLANNERTGRFALPDSTAPIISITSPLKDSTISGNVDLHVTATDNVSVVKVEYYVDETINSASSLTPFNSLWNTSLIRSGQHTIYAKAYDADGNVGLSDKINVSVKNIDQTLLNIDEFNPSTNILNSLNVKNDSRITETINANGGISTKLIPAGLVNIQNISNILSQIKDVSIIPVLQCANTPQKTTIIVTYDNKVSPDLSCYGIVSKRPRIKISQSVDNSYLLTQLVSEIQNMQSIVDKYIVPQCNSMVLYKNGIKLNNNDLILPNDKIDVTVTGENGSIKTGIERRYSASTSNPVFDLNGASNPGSYIFYGRDLVISPAKLTNQIIKGYVTDSEGNKLYGGNCQINLNIRSY